MVPSWNGKRITHEPQRASAGDHSFTVARQHESSPITGLTNLARRAWDHLHVAWPVDAFLANRVAVGTVPAALRADDGGPLFHDRCLSSARCGRSPPTSQLHLVCRLLEHRARRHHGRPIVLWFTASRPSHRRCSCVVSRGSCSGRADATARAERVERPLVVAVVAHGADTLYIAPSRPPSCPPTSPALPIDGRWAPRSNSGRPR